MAGTSSVLAGVMGTDNRQKLMCEGYGAHSMYGPDRCLCSRLIRHAGHSRCGSDVSDR